VPLQIPPPHYLRNHPCRWQQHRSPSAISAAPRALAKVKQPLSDKFIFTTLEDFRGDQQPRSGSPGYDTV
jgi:hypothetical protein